MNIEKLKKLITSEEYPGASYIIRPDGKRKKISQLRRESSLLLFQINSKVTR